MSLTEYIYGEPWTHRHERRERAAVGELEKLAVFVERCGGAYRALPHKPKIIADFGERGRATWRPRTAAFMWRDAGKVGCLAIAHLHSVEAVCDEIHRHLLRQRMSTRGGVA